MKRVCRMNVAPLLILTLLHIIFYPDLCECLCINRNDLNSKITVLVEANVEYLPPHNEHHKKDDNELDILLTKFRF